MFFSRLLFVGINVAKIAHNQTMIKTKISLNDAKKYVRSLMGKSIDVKVNLGRNKSVCYHGVIAAMYPALFTIAPSECFNGKTSFSYSELLCGGVKLRVKQA